MHFTIKQIEKCNIKTKAFISESEIYMYNMHFITFSYGIFRNTVELK